MRQDACDGHCAGGSICGRSTNIRAARSERRKSSGNPSRTHYAKQQEHTADASHDLPDQVAAEVTYFFKMCQNKLVQQGLAPDKATAFLSTIVGALVVANALRDTAEYDRATTGLLQEREPAPV